MKTEVIHARVEPALKHSTEKLLRKLGMTMTQFISLSCRQAVLQKGLPFSVKIPNKETLHSFKEAKEGKVTYYASVDDMIDKLSE